MFFEHEVSYTKDIAFNICGPVDFSDIKLKCLPVLWAQQAIKMTDIFISKSPLLSGEVLQTLGSLT